MSWEHDGEGNEPFSLGKVTCEGATDKALKVRSGKGLASKSTWVPRSVVHEDSEVQEKGDMGEMFVKQWYANKEGL